VPIGRIFADPSALQGVSTPGSSTAAPPGAEPKIGGVSAPLQGFAPLDYSPAPLPGINTWHPQCSLPHLRHDGAVFRAWDAAGAQDISAVVQGQRGGRLEAEAKSSWTIASNPGGSIQRQPCT